MPVWGTSILQFGPKGRSHPTQAQGNALGDPKQSKSPALLQFGPKGQSHASQGQRPGEPFVAFVSFCSRLVCTGQDKL